MFSCAFPLFPIVLIIYNWVQMKLDIIEYTGSNNRPSKAKVRLKLEGIWILTPSLQ